LRSHNISPPFPPCPAQAAPAPPQPGRPAHLPPRAAPRQATSADSRAATLATTATAAISASCGPSAGSRSWAPACVWHLMPKGALCCNLGSNFWLEQVEASGAKRGWGGGSAWSWVFRERQRGSGDSRWPGGVAQSVAQGRGRPGCRSALLERQVERREQEARRSAAPEREGQ
jgi:hypothetical protein